MQAILTVECDYTTQSTLHQNLKCVQADFISCMVTWL